VTDPETGSDFARLRHDLQNKVHVLLGFLELLEMEDLPASMKEDVGEVTRAAKDVAALVEELPK
jgi:signal transduction histidine kinase